MITYELLILQSEFELGSPAACDPRPCNLFINGATKLSCEEISPKKKKKKNDSWHTVDELNKYNITVFRCCWKVEKSQSLQRIRLMLVQTNFQHRTNVHENGIFKHWLNKHSFLIQVQCDQQFYFFFTSIIKKQKSRTAKLQFIVQFLS